MRLNLGAGEDIREGFVNVDIRKIPGIDIVADVRELPADQIPAESCTEILAYDLLEHISFRQTVNTLKHWISKLAPGGTIVVRVPDLHKILDRFVNGRLPAFEAQRLVFGGQDYGFNFHQAGFTEGTLEGLLLASGCSEIIQVVREDNSHNVTLVARK